MNGYVSKPVQPTHLIAMVEHHLLLAVRCIGFGNRAWVALTLTNLVSSSDVLSPAPARPQLLLCEGQTCDLVPILAMAAGLTEPGAERNGLPVRITALVHNQDGLAASGSQEAPWMRHAH